MATRRLRTVTGEGLPDLLTVEEAAAILRIGRSKAYALARQWRATGGLSGLPVLDFGNVLRVPRHALEAMVGGELHSITNLQIMLDANTQTGPTRPDPTSATAATAPDPDQQRPSRRPRTRPVAQLDLFEPPAAS